MSAIEVGPIRECYGYGSDTPVIRDEFTVDMNDGKYSNSRRLMTYGLGGCYAIMIYAKQGDERHGIMTHYSPLNLDDNLKKLEQIAAKHPEIKSLENKKAVILYPERLGEHNRINLSHLECGIRCYFGDDTKVTAKEYPNYDAEAIDAYLVLNPGYWTSPIGGENF